ncbi:vomeronasal type-2 receptor 26-like [Elgaria multicarinata webbii]|uniref:vomeronasal type-2 receptor 26-like n=1 Tax=Elgaria multicarinata webbii TaxID=159646 RepID=UPI002FCCC74A
MDDDSGELFVKNILRILNQRGICPAFTAKIAKMVFFDDFLNVQANWNKTFVDLIEKKANVIVVHGETKTMLCLRMLLRGGENDSDKVFGKVWIMVAQLDFAALAIHKDWDIETFHGALAFTTHSHEVPGFQYFLQNLRPHLDHGDGFIQTFWEQAFGCSFANSGSNEEDVKSCTGEEKLESVPGPFFEMSMTGHSYMIYNTAHILANSVHAMHSSKSMFKVMAARKRLEHNYMHPWQLHHILRNFSFNNSAGETVFLNENGEFTTWFDIINVITFPNNSFARVKVGRMNPWTLSGKDFSIDEDAIIWPRSFNQVIPLSLCNDVCHPGNQKKKVEGKPFCCYDCALCPKGKISQQADHLGMSLGISTLAFSLISSLVLGVFIMHHNTPIVKANNRNLTYTLLISLELCFPCALLFIGRPEKAMCLLQQIAFGMVFSLAVSCVLAKTITVVLAFMATKPGSSMRKWMGKTVANSIIVLCSLVQASISAVWLATSPPFPDSDMNSVAEEIVLKCNEGSVTMFYFVLGYMGLLAFVSFIVAFQARKLPDSFNEAKFITFSMLVFCSVWLSFVPSYLSSKGRYMVAVEIFSILASSAGLLCFIFFPKCYVIVLRPELNKREQLLKRKK